MAVAAVNPISTTSAIASASGGIADDAPRSLRGTFLAALRDAAGTAAPTDDVRDIAGKLVSEMLLKPLLAELRQFPFGKSFSSGGRGEEVFGEMLDERLADTAGKTAGAAITSFIQTQIERMSKAGGAAQAGATQQEQRP
ncbi:MAG: hypothetical protein CHACPFDD_02503 [Phycisphaerae bacterium]|nr:hypothetical protein [Phycisphaerae bacterium]